MNNAWKQWEGQVVEEKFKLRQYIGGSQRSAVFLTDFAGEEPREAGRRGSRGRGEGGERLVRPVEYREGHFRGDPAPVAPAVKLGGRIRLGQPIISLRLCSHR